MSDVSDWAYVALVLGVLVFIAGVSMPSRLRSVKTTVSWIRYANPQKPAEDTKTQVECVGDQRACSTDETYVERTTTPNPIRTPLLVAGAGFAAVGGAKILG